MQPIRRLEEILRTQSDAEHCLYSASSLRCFFETMDECAYLKLLSRAVKGGLLERVCKGVYLYPGVKYDPSTILYRTACILRSDRFVYLSLESVLSHWSIISQQLLDCITVMTNGREGFVDCGRFGRIEFVHFKRKPAEIMAYVSYNPDLYMLEASPQLAYRDMVRCGRSMDLVDEDEYRWTLEELEMLGKQAFKRKIDSLIVERPELAVLRVTLEKEVFHQDILRAMDGAGLLKFLTFMGGTCLRLCHGFSRMSEDLDFASDHELSEAEAESVGLSVKSFIEQKYGYDVTFRKPIKDTDTDTWIISIVTHPERSDLPRQHIHIDICHYPARRRELCRVRNPYGLDLDELFVNSESLEEILCDKIIAFALRNRIKNRDLWDLYVLANHQVALDRALLESKVQERKLSVSLFYEKFDMRLGELKSDGLPSDFRQELGRFVLNSEFESCSLSRPNAALVMHSVISGFMK